MGVNGMNWKHVGTAMLTVEATWWWHISWTIDLDKAFWERRWRNTAKIPRYPGTLVVVLIRPEDRTAMQWTWVHQQRYVCSAPVRSCGAESWTSRDSYGFAHDKHWNGEPLKCSFSGVYHVHHSPKTKLWRSQEWPRLLLFLSETISYFDPFPGELSNLMPNCGVATLSCWNGQWQTKDQQKLCLFFFWSFHVFSDFIWSKGTDFCFG